jgi:hypothetical protein
MCRNIRVLSHFEPPTTPEEVRDAALQFVRKVSGQTKPKMVDQAAFDRAVAVIAETTSTLLADLAPASGARRTREGERARAKAKWAAREARAQDGRR